MTDRECEQEHGYDRERQALYLVGLLPLHDLKECKETLALCERLLPLVTPRVMTDEARTD
jgi:hypothetical protein